ncbi:methylmalonyl Co-A mutase-associated GTPase MeaB [Pikeienuella sp. HZG-20]|uniref:methylmalonyl Co-A mutase-associated GTPase MeaB n=1 Tax=Paludibacillus litoralis TaxID=3133267 RepID=UPI0030ED8B3D
MSAADDLRKRLVSGERRALAQAITLVESTREDHRATARELIDSLYSDSGHTIRLGLTGTPGVGKSTFIEAFGLKMIERGLKVAVLAVDPSSTRSGGSVLGDKTRMERLSRAPGAFIRPSPSRSALGGVARRTREAIILCEAAGHDVVIVETVGVGQSETMVADMTDLFLLLLAPAGGDELQGVKRGIMEIADLIVVNKADGDLKAAAVRTAADYAGALRLMRRREGDPKDVPAAMTASALTGDGLERVWARLTALDAYRRKSGFHAARRRAQAVRWMRFELDEGLKAAFAADPRIARALPEAIRRVEAGDAAPSLAAEELLALFLEPTKPPDPISKPMKA